MDAVEGGLGALGARLLLGEAAALGGEVAAQLRGLGADLVAGRGLGGEAVAQAGGLRVGGDGGGGLLGLRRADVGEEGGE